MFVKQAVLQSIIHGMNRQYAPRWRSTRSGCATEVSGIEGALASPRLCRSGAPPRRRMKGRISKHSRVTEHGRVSFVFAASSRSQWQAHQKSSSSRSRRQRGARPACCAGSGSSSVSWALAAILGARRRAGRQRPGRGVPACRCMAALRSAEAAQLCCWAIWL